MVDDREPHERLKEAREKAGIPSARAAALRFGWKLSSYAAHENGSRAFDSDDARRYGRALRVSPEWLLLGVASSDGDAVPIVGIAGAAPMGAIRYEDPGRLGDAPMPPGGSERTVAVEVRGDSARGIAEDGWLVYYDDRRDPPTEDLYGEVCVIGLADEDHAVLKKLMRGRKKNHFDLESVSSAPTMYDQRVAWAAPVIAIVPRRQARRLIRR
jgi:phage repressor protein C with HTH and peptisase S24 domain